ncbi:hypothetical protein AAVH_26684 [Aphelenchoides avenae]|nr:hypothetical protein AAVH_26684 [Aphelenchus avenae]
MSKRPHSSQSASSSENLIERLKAAANDIGRLSEIIESNDNVSVAAAFSALLAGGDSSAQSVS